MSVANPKGGGQEPDVISPGAPLFSLTPQGSRKTLLTGDIRTVRVRQIRRERISNERSEPEGRRAGARRNLSGRAIFKKAIPWRVAF